MQAASHEAEPATVSAQVAARQTAQAEPAEPLNLKAHAEDPDSLESALSDSGRPRRRARRAASRRPAPPRPDLRGSTSFRAARSV